MRRYWNNKGRIIFLSGLFALCSSLLFALCLILPDMASSGPYLSSAHGNTTDGVKRSATGFPTDYTRGLCAHCHEKHASIGGAEPVPTGGPSKYELLANNFSGKTTKLYAQSDSVCFYCHIVTGTYQSPAFYNYSYSITFAGNPDTTPNNIFDTFNSTSYHNQYDVFRFITGLSGSHPNFSNFPSDSNPCSGCHNVHIAKRSCGKPSGSYDDTKSAISKPSDHGNLWGDGVGEKMNNYTGGYQAPYWYGSTTAYEPANNTTYGGSNLPDYVTFCTNCHNATNTIYSTTLGRNLKKIDWNVELHGKGEFGGNHCPQNPYNVGGTVLSCTDCHEPHGSPNVFLLRNEVNGAKLDNPITAFSLDLCTFPGTDGNKVLGWLCKRCHTDDHDKAPATYPDANTWKETHHYTTCANPYARTKCAWCHTSATGQPISCHCCHYHGAHSTDYGANHPCYKHPCYSSGYCCTGVCCPEVCYAPCDRRTF